jgi:TolA-binding protein
LTVCVCCGFARGDEVQWRGISLPQPEITGAQDFTVTYRLRNRSEQSRPVNELDRLAVDGMDQFNRAERLVGRDPAQAIGLYQQAATGASGWKQRLARYRLFQAADKARRFDLAAETWLDLAGPTPSKVALDLIPSTYGEKGSETNARAIQLLKARLEAAGDGALGQAIRQMLVGVYRAEGQAEEAAEIASEVIDSAGTGSTGAGGQLQAVQALVDRGDYAKAIGTLQAGMNRYTDELPQAMLLMARAKLGQWDKSGQRQRDALLEAGLFAMRVYAFYPASPAAPEALMVAGEVNGHLGNLPAAQAAYGKVVERYGNSPQATKAREALRKLQRSE